MYELVQAGDRTWYIESPTKIGVWQANEHDVYLIDSGNDKEAGRKVRQVLDKNGWTLKGILNTHSHADHAGGNRYLQTNTGCKIFASSIEGAFLAHPILEPAYLYGGCPPSDLRHKFLMAQESTPLPLEDSAFPKEIEVLPLPGHYFGQVGYRTPDDILFIADSLSSRQTLDKYLISVLYDVEEAMHTYDTLDTLKAKLFIPSHDSVSTDIHDLISYNREKVMEVKSAILSLCTTPKTFEEILTGLFNKYHLTLNFEQYGLVGSTIRSYLTWMKEQGELLIAFSDNKLLWERNNG